MSDAAASPRAGAPYGHYVLKRLLGSGPMGQVYEAEVTVTGRAVAVKILPEKLSGDAAFRTRFDKGVSSAARLAEPHLIAIHEYGELDERLYVDMRLVDGISVRQLLDRDGPLAPTLAVAVVREVAAALDAAHAAGLVHGHIEPTNVLVAVDDQVYLMDLGIASAVVDDQLAELGGNPYRYIAPERVDNGQVTRSTDIYALTCLLYECLTGSPPYATVSVSKLIAAHLLQPVPRPGELNPHVPGTFDEVIARGMAKKPEDRYSSAPELAEAASEALLSTGQSVSATGAEAPSAAAPQAAPAGRPNLMRQAKLGEEALPFHDDVHFTVFRPRFLRTRSWTPLLACAHLGEASLGSDRHDDPIRQVEERAKTLLGDQFHTYAKLSQDSSIGLPEDAEITFDLSLPNLQIDQPRRTFLWINAFHMEEFHIRAPTQLHGLTTRGRLLIYHGSILLAEVALSIKVDEQAPQESPLTEARVSVAPYRKIFPSYSHKDTAIVVQFERFAEAVGDRYLRDVRTLRSGEKWNPRLCEFISEADVFQLFWSHNSMRSKFVEQEWRYALSLLRDGFIRPTYWEDPMPEADGLPPEELGELHFHPFDRAVLRSEQAAGTAAQPTPERHAPVATATPDTNMAQPGRAASPPAQPSSPRPRPAPSASSPGARRGRRARWGIVAAAVTAVAVIVGLPIIGSMNKVSSYGPPAAAPSSTPIAGAEAPGAEPPAAEPPAAAPPAAGHHPGYWTPDSTAAPAAEPPPAEPPTAEPPAAAPHTAAPHAAAPPVAAPPPPPPPPPSELTLRVDNTGSFVSITNNANKPAVGCVIRFVAVAGEATLIHYDHSDNFTVTGSAETRINHHGPATGSTFHATVTCDNGLSTSQDVIY